VVGCEWGVGGCGGCVVSGESGGEWRESGERVVSGGVW
jgi:hypothetical protein